MAHTSQCRKSRSQTWTRCASTHTFAQSVCTFSRGWHLESWHVSCKLHTQQLNLFHGLNVMSDLTEVMRGIESGDAIAVDELLPLVYGELRRLASQKLMDEPVGQTLQPTALVHEAYLRLIGSAPQTWNCRAHFFAAAAEAMRRILIDNARRKGRLKRGGGRRRLNLDQVDVAAKASCDELSSLHEALSKLEAEDKMKAELVRLRYFAGLTLEEAAELLNISRATASRYWAYARAWLYHEINKGHERRPPEFFSS